MFINYNQKRCLDDDNLKYQMNKDCIFITEKIMTINIVKTVRLCVQIMIFAYFVGAYWLIFTLMAGRFEKDGNDEFSHYHGINEESAGRKVLISMYFAFTSLSTIGFGDYYPVSDLERLVGSVVLLFGVAMFSYILADLLSSIKRFRQFDQLPGREEDLDKFFAML